MTETNLRLAFMNQLAYLREQGYARKGSKKEFPINVDGVRVARVTGDELLPAHEDQTIAKLTQKYIGGRQKNKEISG